MTYQKKNFYKKTPKAIIKKITNMNVGKEFLAQEETELIIDGSKIPTSDIDVKSLYETIMKK